MIETKNPLPPRSVIEQTYTENNTCPKGIEDENCGKPMISADMEFYGGNWTFLFSCEDGHEWRRDIKELSAS